MLIATEIMRTEDKHSNRETLHGGGGGGSYFVLSFENGPDFFGQDCSTTECLVPVFVLRCHKDLFNLTLCLKTTQQ